MEFKDFAHKLFSIIGAGSSTHAFTRTLFEVVVSEKGQAILDEYGPDTYKAYYNGNTQITRIAKKILPYVDISSFQRYLSEFSDDVCKSLADAFSDVEPAISEYIAPDILADIFLNIINEAAFKKRNSAKSKVNRAKNTFADETYESIYGDEVVDDMDTVIVNSDGIVPELTENAPYIMIPTGILSPVSSYDYEEYLNGVKSKYSKVKTLLYTQPQDFYSFYVCNDIVQKKHNYSKTKKENVIINAEINKIHSLSNFVIITGTGGIGKSMMMRHLLLSAVEDYPILEKVPIFIPLKDYSLSYTDLFQFVLKNVECYDKDFNTEKLEELLDSGQAILLFDGLDEINTEHRRKFEHDLEFFSDRYKENSFIISSRPYGDFRAFNRFMVLELSPLSKDQALTLIDKLVFREDEPEIKASFKRILFSTLYRTHRAFVENPLLLTIMLMTYEQYAEIPSKMHVFYHEAYVTLAQRHDASKGSYTRILKTGLTASRFADYFAELCARSYRDQKFELTELEFEKYFNILNEKKKDDYTLNASDFLYDLTVNMCLMFYEGQKYHFIHRSFQEYFCALYFSKQKDKTLSAIGEVFEKMETRNYADQTFDMLYDMIPEKVEEYIFLPFLDDLISRCKKDRGYISFLKTMYPTIYYDYGRVASSNTNNPNSFLYNFIATKKGLKRKIADDELPIIEEFITDTYICVEYFVSLRNGEDFDIEYELVNERDFTYDGTHDYDPNPTGYNLSFDVDTVLENQEEYAELVEILNDDSFALKTEYNSICAYSDKLKEKQEPIGTDLFDMF